ncbi:MAG: ABC-type multidrug transport system, ATPase and permease component [Clostridia bacterium]|nr:ABC-type multidrug transport system, ATPase and permease component [Clostridia bacterium]
MLKLAKYLKPFSLTLGIAIILLFVQAMCDLAMPDFMSEIVNKGITNGDSAYILQKGVGMLGVALISAASTVIVGFLAARIAAGLSKNLRMDVFKKVQNLSNNEFDKFSTASLITRTTNDITQIQTLMVLMIRMIFYAPIMGIGGLIKALSENVSMSWIIALAIFCLLGLIGLMFTVAIPKFKIIQNLTDRLNLVTRENLTGMLVIRAFSTQKFEEKRFDKANSELTETNLFVNRTMVVMMPAMMLIMNIVTVLIVWVGAKQISAFKMEVGDMMAFMQYAMQIIMSFVMLAIMFIMIPRASVSAQRIAEVLETEPVIKDREELRAFHKDFKGTVEFRDVSFRYPGAEEDVLQHINFTAKPGQTTAFIGSTGSGKSTLINDTSFL